MVLCQWANYDHKIKLLLCMGVVYTLAYTRMWKETFLLLIKYANYRLYRLAAEASI